MAAAANMFSVRIVTADYYMASPLPGLDICQSPLTQHPVKKVPVVRVFGATPAGKRERAGAGGSASAGVVWAALPAAHSRARRRPSPGSLRSLPSSRLCSPSLPRVTGGAKKMWVRASAAPPSAAKRRRALGLYSASGGRAGGRAGVHLSVGRVAAPGPQGRVRGSLEVGRR